MYLQLARITLKRTSNTMASAPSAPIPDSSVSYSVSVRYVAASNDIPSIRFHPFSHSTLLYSFSSFPLSLQATANGMAASSLGTEAPVNNLHALNDAIGRIKHSNQAGNHVNNNHNVDNMNISVNTLTNDVKCIARFLVVNEADHEIRSFALRSFLELVMQALEDNDSEIAELKERITELEAKIHD